MRSVLDTAQLLQELQLGELEFVDQLVREDLWELLEPIVLLDRTSRRIGTYR
jgi:hypothetical protein